MAYEELASEMERQSNALVQKTIQQAALQPDLASIDQQLLVQMLERHLTRMVEYVRLGDLKEWQAYLGTLGREPVTKGISVNNLLELGGLLFAQLLSLVDETFNTPAQAHDRERYIRRLNGSRSVARTTVIASNLNPSGS